MEEEQEKHKNVRATFVFGLKNYGRGGTLEQGICCDVSM